MESWTRGLNVSQSMPYLPQRWAWRHVFGNLTVLCGQRSYRAIYDTGISAITNSTSRHPRCHSNGHLQEEREGCSCSCSGQLSSTGRLPILTFLCKTATATRWKWSTSQPRHLIVVATGTCLASGCSGQLSSPTCAPCDTIQRDSDNAID